MITDVEVTVGRVSLWRDITLAGGSLTHLTSSNGALNSI